MPKGNKTNHPKKYVRCSDWEKWIITQWIPFRQNDLPHLLNDISWLKKITIGLLITIVAAAIAIIIGD